MHRTDVWTVCFLTGFQEEGYDQAVNISETIQVCSALQFTLDYLRTDRHSRVGDIVDIKANGAVQKG